MDMKPPPGWNPRFTEDGRFMFFDEDEVPTAANEAGHPYRAGAAAPAKMTLWQWLRCKLGAHDYLPVGLGGDTIYYRCKRCKEKNTLVLTDSVIPYVNKYLAWSRQRRERR